jgi:hypothetical protein
VLPLHACVAGGLRPSLHRRAAAARSGSSGGDDDDNRRGRRCVHALLDAWPDRPRGPFSCPIPPGLLRLPLTHYSPAPASCACTHPILCRCLASSNRYLRWVSAPVGDGAREASRRGPPTGPRGLVYVRFFFFCTNTLFKTALKLHFKTALGLVRLCRITSGIVKANQSLYKLDKQSG